MTGGGVAVVLDRLRRKRPAKLELVRGDERTTVDIPKGSRRWVRTIEMIEADYPDTTAANLIDRSGETVGRVDAWWTPDRSTEEQQLSPEEAAFSVIQQAAQWGAEVQARAYADAIKLVTDLWKITAAPLAKVAASKNAESTGLIDRLIGAADKMSEASGEAGTTDQDVQAMLIDKLGTMGQAFMLKQASEAKALEAAAKATEAAAKAGA